MTDRQHTIAKAMTLNGVGLHSGAKVRLSIAPSERGGIVFIRTDMEGQPRIPASVLKVVDTSRGTTIGQDGATVSTIEHVMAALYALGVSHAEISIDGPEMPILDGSSKPVVDALISAGIKELEGQREVLAIHENFSFTDENSGASYLIIPAEKTSYTVLIDYNSRVLAPQHAVLHDIKDFLEQIAPSRTFCFLHELEYLLAKQLIKGGNLDNALVFVEEVLDEAHQRRLATLFNQPDVAVTREGVLNNADTRFSNEPARHKLLDLIGDLALLGADIKGHIIATKPGHAGNAALGKALAAMLKESRKPQAPRIDLNSKPLMDVNAIMARLPHRPPFLFVDKIFELTETHVVGIKNVSMNEPFFVGHFPGAPVMPGVLQIEAMAQVGGILVLGTVPDPENWLTYFLKMDNVKFRKMVMPGDTLIFRMDLLSPIRRGLCHMQGYAYVNGEMVMEAELMAQIQRRSDM
jgi:UDP-3-O-[3-hydroxymyristoyl] N-acetylglucosamine deacetylase / 3-hydroxyacyl-[acyl-carrier-protein] dehydratase